MKPVLLVIGGPNGSGKTTITTRLRTKDAGYFVRIFFVGTRDPRINAARVAGRVMQGGHSVPIEKIVARFARSLANLARAIPLADRVYAYDNSIEDQDAVLCARTRDGALRKVYAELPEWVSDAVSDVPRDPKFVDLRTEAGILGS